VFFVANVVSARDPEVVRYAAHLLRQGELVCFPTDTVYGIGAAAKNDEAVKRLYAVKGRPPTKPLPLLVSNTLEVPPVAEMTSLGQHLMARFWPGGLTIVFKKHPYFYSAALAKGNTVALRIPDHDLTRDIIRELGEPVTGTSANRSGARAPVSAMEAAFQLGDLVALVVDGGRTPGGVESTVLDISGEAPVIVREGAISRRELEDAMNRKIRESSG
jgi:L-threonylcarbamoyladenylate synthase